MKKRILAICVALATLGSAVAQTEEEVVIRNGERSIYGVLSRPSDGASRQGKATGGRKNGGSKAKAKKQPVAIIAHGFNGGHQFGKSYFETLNALGYQCYTFDFPGGSIHSRSDNNTMHMSVRKEQSDLRAIIRHFQQQPEVDASRIVLIGESQGGLVSALTAAEQPKDIYRLILVYPAFCIPDNWNKRYPDVAAIPDTTRLWNVPLSRDFFLELRDMEPYAESVKYKKPVLIIHGDADPIVPIRYAERAAKEYKKAELKVIEKAGHGFKPEERKQALDWIREFLK